MPRLNSSKDDAENVIISFKYHALFIGIWDTGSEQVPLSCYPCRVAGAIEDMMLISSPRCRSDYFRPSPRDHATLFNKCRYSNMIMKEENTSRRMTSMNNEYQASRVRGRARNTETTGLLLGFTLVFKTIQKSLHQNCQSRTIFLH